MAKDEGDEVACPVCGKIVGVDVSSCPYCGAEFEEGDVPEEAPAAAAKPASAATSDDEEDVACPVCGFLVGIDVVTCPKCGAEFEEEEIEEVIEVEEKTIFEEEPEPARTKAKPAEKAKAKAKPAEKAKPRARPREPTPAAADVPASILDLRVIGVALIILGIVGTQIALFIDWYWSWVPPIEDNLALFVIIPVVLLVVGLLAFMMVKKAMSAGKEMPRTMPGTSLSLFLFGILALIIIVLWDPINSAMQDSQAMVAGVFAIALVLGILFVFMGSRSASKKAACD